MYYIGQEIDGTHTVRCCPDTGTRDIVVGLTELQALLFIHFLNGGPITKPVDDVLKAIAKLEAEKEALQAQYAAKDAIEPEGNT